MAGTMNLSRDFRELFECLSSREVRYLVVGGYAVAFHGHPRYTKDIDVWVEPTRANAERLMKALEDFGFGSSTLTVEDFLEPGYVVRLGHPPQRIDVLTSLKGVEFSACYPARVTQDIEGTKVDFIDLASLKVNKRTVGRHQDLADLENLR